ncbi:MAG: phosphoglycerate kinase [Polaromonas sp.]|nr:phosphoglycerate kinase [Polaromonas sp.]
MARPLHADPGLRGETGAAPARRLWLVRHAQPLVDPGTCYGRLDVAADANATRNCAAQLAGILPRGLSVVTSPLQRCEQLAPVLIGLRPDLTCKTDPRLQEMHFGAWEGRPWLGIAREELDAWTASFGSHAAGSTGESTDGFMARVGAAFDELAMAPDTLWITHAGVIRAAGLLSSGIRRVARADQWPRQAPAYGQWCTLTLPATPGNRHCV